MLGHAHSTRWWCSSVDEGGVKLETLWPAVLLDLLWDMWIRYNIIKNQVKNGCKEENTVLN